MRVFIGVDPRQPVAYNVLQFSIMGRASKPVQIVPLVLPQLPITRRGLTDFTFSRYLPPFLCGYKGYSLFLDADMLCLGDIHELFAWAESAPLASVYVVKNAQRFEWPSAMLFNNAMCRDLTPEYINNPDTKPQSFEWAASVGELPPEWNHCVGYDEPKPAKLVHYTQGIPIWKEVQDCDYAGEWLAEHEAANSTVSWFELMGASVHAEPVLTRLQARMASYEESRRVAPAKPEPSIILP